MRNSNPASAAAVCVVLVTAIVAGACGASAAPTPPPTPRPTPVITPDPHLTAPASVDDVFRQLGKADLRITPNTATAGQGGEPVKRINATYAEWPLVLTEFSTVEAVQTAGRFDPKAKPKFGDAPFAIAGLNILVEFGPQVTNDGTPATPDEIKTAAFIALVAALDPLLGPLAQRSVTPVPLPTLTPRPTAAPSVAPATPAASAAP